ncbi:hypothetical protein HY479_02730 [Candidatus Uhrbacteria bacterium]|nr:hypothetical protein [Candidatus Uhrbacteria bacterium]
MRHGLAACLIGIAFIGAGCPFGQNLASPKIAQPIGEAFPARPISQARGFGDIPDVPPPPLRPGSRGSVLVRAELPTIPAAMTVLRLKSGQPDETVLRNIGGSIGIPGGLIGTHPTTRELLIEWRDEHGVRWSYFGRERRVEFTDTSKPMKTLTVSAWPSAERVLQEAAAFLHTKGIGRSRYGTSYIEPDWASWVASEEQAGRCINQPSLEMIRVMATMTELRQRDLPLLPNAGQTACLNPEFPSRITVRMNATQDGQAIFTGDGTPYPGAVLVVDALTGDVVSGSFLLSADPDRSDYPAQSIDEARKRLAQGGQGGTPQGDVTVENISFEWYRVDDREDPPTSYLYPAMVGSGTITYPDSRSGPYRIIVPLVK